MGKLILLIASIILLIIPVCASDIQKCGVCHPEVAKNFTNSLHYTNQGIIEKWKIGAGRDLGIPLPQDCLSCHIENCSTCHPIHKTLPSMNICISCHKNGANYVGYLVGMVKRGKNLDIHYKYNLTCFDCHKIEEIHGDGKKYTMAQFAVKVRCEDCHMNEVVIKGIKPKQYDPTTLAHSIHGDKISCYGCHAGWYQTCAECHFDKGSAEGVTLDEFHLVRGVDGKLYPAVKTFAFYDNRSSYIWSIIYPHTISEGRRCEDCHNNEEEVFCVGAVGRVMPPGSSFAEPPSSLDINIPKVNLRIDTELLVGVIIGGTLGGICIHYIKRRITVH